MARFTFAKALQEVRAGMTSTKRTVLTVIASILVFLGAVGTFIPFFPGKIVAAPGLLIFSVYSPSIYASLTRYAQKYPRFQSLFDRLRNWIVHRIH